MKATLFSILLLLVALTVSAQPYQSIFGKTSTSWIYRWGNLFGQQNDTAFIKGDTVVNGLSYKKFTGSIPYNGMLREDTATGKVWTRMLPSSLYTADTIERLLFDFSLAVGDTFNMNNDYYVGVDTVDSVKIINGVKHIYFRQQFTNKEPITFIEGIGCNTGIFIYYKNTVKGGDYLLCSYKDGFRTPYINLRYLGNCSPSTNINATPSRFIDIKLYPIPAKDILYLDNRSNNSISRIQVMETTGRLLQDITETNITSVNLTNLPSGYFFLRIYLDEQTITKPLLVHK